MIATEDVAPVVLIGDDGSHRASGAFIHIRSVGFDAYPGTRSQLRHRRRYRRRPWMAPPSEASDFDDSCWNEDFPWQDVSTGQLSDVFFLNLLSDIESQAVLLYAVPFFLPDADSDDVAMRPEQVSHRVFFG